MGWDGKFPENKQYICGGSFNILPEGAHVPSGLPGMADPYKVCQPVTTGGRWTYCLTSTVTNCKEFIPHKEFILFYSFLENQAYVIAGSVPPDNPRSHCQTSAKPGRVSKTNSVPVSLWGRGGEIEEGEPQGCLSRTGRVEWQQHLVSFSG